MHKFLIDVNVPKSIWQLLKKEKFPFLLLHSIDREMNDIDVAKLAVKKQYTIITCDKDFSRLKALFPDLKVFIFDSKNQDPALKVKLFKSVLYFLRKDPDFDCGCTILKC